jgi:tryptophanyl-tRNA synthetase
VEGLEGRPEADNLIGIFAALTNTDKAAVLRDFGGKQFSEFKASLAELAVAQLSPITQEMRRLVNDPAYIDGVLRDGGERASVIAEETMHNVRDIVGFLQN